MKIKLIIICSIFLINLMQSSFCKTIKPPKIGYILGILFVYVTLKAFIFVAIIGAGIGGASAAYFLNELFGGDGANIHIYERDVVGGRLATTNINGRYFEVGGSVIHPRNKYLSQFMDLFGNYLTILLE